MTEYQLDNPQVVFMEESIMKNGIGQTKSESLTKRLFWYVRMNRFYLYADENNNKYLVEAPDGFNGEFVVARIWFTEMTETERATDLYSLAEIKNVRKENSGKGYIAGKYGAVPMLNLNFADIA